MIGLLRRARARARGREPERACNQCAGLTGAPRIADAPTCMPCVLRFTRLTAERLDQERQRVP